MTRNGCAYHSHTWTQSEAGGYCPACDTYLDEFRAVVKHCGEQQAVCPIPGSKITRNTEVPAADA